MWLLGKQWIFDDDDDDDDDDYDDELLLHNGWLTTNIKPWLQSGPLSEIFTMANLWYATIRNWTCTEPEFRLWCMKLCSIGNHFIVIPFVLYLHKNLWDSCRGPFHAEIIPKRAPGPLVAMALTLWLLTPGSNSLFWMKHKLT